jgi:hypothetical protein
MPILVGFAILVLTIFALKAYTNAPPALLARLLRRVGGVGALGAGAFLFTRGRIDFGMFLIGAGLWMLGLWRIASNPFSGFGSATRAAGVSRVRSAMIEMELDHTTGSIRGVVLAGRDEGKRLDALTRTSLMELYASCRTDDPDGARLLEVYLDRRFPGWRQAGNGDGDPGRANSGARRRPATISEDEAYEILGLKKGAARQDIARAHRDLMKKLHPDHGGTTDLAARVNEAKEVLMRRHH